MTKLIVSALLGLLLGGSRLEAQATRESVHDDSASPAAGWSQLVKGGFGDRNLEILGPFAEFQGQLYVATMHKSAGAQIWRSADGSTWEAVVGSSARTPAGFGNPGDKSINKLLAFDGWLYASIWNEAQGGEVWRSADGVTWEASVGGTAPTARGFGKLENSGITALGGFHDTVFAGTGSLYCKDGVELWRSQDHGATWEPVAGERYALQTALARESKYFLDLEVFQNVLYISTGDQRTGGSEIWRSFDGGSWDAVVGAPSGYRAGMGKSSDDMIYDLTVFQDHLYAGVLNFMREGGSLWRTGDGTTWEVVIGGDVKPETAGFGRRENFGITRVATFSDHLYAGTVNEQGTELWKSRDGLHWGLVVGPDRVPSSGFGNPNNRAINGLFVFQGRLYVGTDNPTEGGEVWRFEPRGGPP